MKNLIMFLFIILLALSCSSVKKSIQEDNTCFFIKRIVSKNSWWIIYAQKQDSLYKIVTAKNVNNNCEKIVIGRYYELELKSRRKNIPVINGVVLKPTNYLEVKSSAYDKNGIECYFYDDKTEICTNPEKGIHDLFYTDDIKGLCYQTPR